MLPVDQLDLTAQARGTVILPPARTAATCPHPVTRMLGGGVCLLCDKAEQEPLVETPLARAELTPLQRASLARRASATRMRRSLALFVQRSWHVLEPETPLEWSWHHDALCDHIQAMLEDWIRKKADMFGFTQRMRNLAINLPPGTAKSRILMVHAVAWMWLRAPGWKVLCVSSNPENVARDAELCRELCGSPWYRTTFAVQWTFREDIDAKKKYKLTAGGERLSRGLIAKFTGVRADAIFVDDLDDAHDVFSEASRKERNSKFKNSIYNRVNDKRCSIRIGLQQRVHVDDWTAQVLADGWAHLTIPMEYAADHQCECTSCVSATRDDRVYTPIGWSDPRGAPGWTAGPILHPDRFPLEDLAEERTRLGPYGYECQYNQRPASLAGGLFERVSFRYFSIAGKPSAGCVRPEGASTLPAVTLGWRKDGSLDVDAIVISVDATFGSVSSTADSVGLLVIATKGADRFVLRDETKKRTYPETRDAVATFDEDGKLIGGLAFEYPGAAIIVEAKAFGAAVVQDLEHHVAGLIPVNPEGGKIARAAAMMPAIAAGNVYLLEGAIWCEEFLAELCMFPNAKHDDRVDALSQVMTYYRVHAAPVSKWRRIAQGRNNLQPRRVT